MEAKDEDKDTQTLAQHIQRDTQSSLGIKLSSIPYPNLYSSRLHSLLNVNVYMEEQCKINVTISPSNRSKT